MSNIQIGDLVFLSTSGYEGNVPGIVRSFSGAFASVEFPNATIRCPAAQLRTTSPNDRRCIEAQAKEEALRIVEQEKERARVEAEKKDAVLSVLRYAMDTNFLGVDELYKSEFTDALELADFLNAKAAFAREWVVRNVGGNGSSVNAPDNEQSAAISSLHGNIQVVARAGSGKTTTLVNRSMFLLKHCGIAPNELLLLAFNRKAAIEIRRSLLLKLVPEASKLLIRPK